MRVPYIAHSFFFDWRSFLAKILDQIKGTSGTIPVEILAQAKAKEPPNEAIPSFFKLYVEKSKVGTLTKEPHNGKLVADWEKLLKEASQKPELVDMAPAVSAFMAVKDTDELVRAHSSYPSSPTERVACRK